MPKKAIILGATGLTGSWVVKKLIADPAYDCIELISRTSSGVTHEKVTEQLVDVLNLKESGINFSGDEVYCCIGTTKKKTPDRDLYRRIDVGIPGQAAEMAAANGIPVFVVVSAIGANANSSIEYNKIKGEMEARVQAAGVERTYIVQPSMILGNREEKRAAERFFMALFRALKAVLIGPLRKYRGVEAEAIAETMIRWAKSGKESRVIPSNEIGFD